MYGTNDFKKGLKIMVKGDPHVILDFQHVKPGKGNQFTRTKLSNLITGALLDLTVRSGEKFPIPDIEYKNISYVYKDSDDFYFMDSKSFETLAVNSKIIANHQVYLMESLEVTGCFFNGKIISIDWPKSLVLKIKETEPGFKGNTVSNTTKPALTETGLSLQVPLHIKIGDKIKVNTKEGTYVERVK